MSMKALPILIVCLLVLLALAPAAEVHVGTPSRDVLFYASYDKGEAADAAGGNARPIAGADKSEPLTGRAGAARTCRAPMSYSAAGNISQERGTVALWFRPQWDPADGKHHALFDWIGASHGYDRISLYKKASATT